MSKPKIVRLFGKADNFDVEFTRDKKGWWYCDVPPDTKDGQYAVTLCAVNEYAETSYWTGELFMCNGVCHVKIRESRNTIWLKPDRYAFDITEKLKIYVRKGCPHESNKFLCR